MSSNSVSLGTVLLVGGCGFLGQRIIDEVQQHGNATAIHLWYLYGSSSELSGVTYHTGDITHRPTVDSILNTVKPTTIFACISPFASKRDPKLFHPVNVDGTRYLLEAVEELGTVRVFIYTSSAGVIHDSRTPLMDATEDMPTLHYPSQPDMYTHTKALAEELVITANRANGSGMLTAVIRPVPIYGEDDHFFTPMLIEGARKGRAERQIGNGKNHFDVVYVGNLAHAHFLAAKALITASDPGVEAVPMDNKVDGEAFVIRDAEHQSFWGLNRYVAALAGHPVNEKRVRAMPVWAALGIAFLLEWGVWIVTLGRKQPGLTRATVRFTTTEKTFSIEKARERLGYEPKVATEEGWKRAVAWFEEQEGEKRV